MVIQKMITSDDEDMRKLGLFVAGVNVKWCSFFGKQFGSSLLSKQEFFDIAVSLLVIYPRKTETSS